MADENADEPLDAAQYVRAYKRAIRAKDETQAEQLRAEWAAYNGGDEDELHELAYGTPED